ncbi:MAG TPA: response regulator transcription factor [Burkholderiales bacterium]|nr:response regulator transcription factor [Burkholderiales bacterium]
MRILVVDDHPLMVSAMGLALGQLDQRADVQSAADLEAAMALAKQARFDLVILDLGLPGVSGVQALQRFRETYPDLPVVVYSGASDSASISAALDLGAMGFIPKTAGKDILLGALRLIVSGGVYIPVEAMKQRADEPAPAAPAASGRSVTELGLSPRQAEVLSLLLKGLPNKLIARRLDISENTAKIHVSAVLHALGVSTRTQALIAASRLGLRLDVP